jgi:hypothetical protein
MPLVIIDLEQWELLALALALVVTIVGLAGRTNCNNKEAAATPHLFVAKANRKKGTMPKKNSKQKKQSQKQAEKKKANKAKIAKAELAVAVAVPAANGLNDAKPEPDRLIENDSSDSESDDDRYCRSGVGGLC